MAGVHAIVARGASVAFVIRACGFGASFLLQIILARTMQADNYGVYTYIIAWARLLAVFCGLGLPQGVLRFLASYRETGEAGKFKGLVGWSTRLTLLAGGMIPLALLAGLLIFGGWRAVEQNVHYLIGALIVPVWALMGLQNSIGKSIGQIALGMGPQLLLRPLLLGTVVGALVTFGVFHVPTDYTTVLTIACGLLVLLSVGQRAALWAKFSEAVKAASPTLDTRTWVRVSLPLLLVAGYAILMKETDILMIGMLSDRANVGVYNAAVKTATVVGMVLQSANAVFAPMAASAYAARNFDGLARLVRLNAHIVFWPSLAVAVGILVIGDPILGLFGERFRQASPVMTVLVFGHLAHAGAGSVAVLLNMTGHQDRTALVMGTTTALNLVLNAIAIPLFGIMGAACATASSMLLWSVWLHFNVAKYLNLKPSILFNMRPPRPKDS
jgi:O-antigen/teichoic acid export membrane protein